MKLLIKLIIAIFALLILTLTLLLIFVDPNDYKSEIETQVKENLNRDLHIVGDIGWTFYPQLGFSSGEIKLDNLAGFSKPHLLKINKASVGINILPLLSGEVSIGKLTLDGFELTVLTNKKGVSNLDNLGNKNELISQQPDVKDDTPVSDKPPFAFDKAQLAGIEINNAIIELQDLQAGSYQKITINEIQLGHFALDKETELIINTKLIIDDIQAEIKLKSLLIVNTELSNIQLNKLQVDTHVTGNVLPNGQLKSVLKTNINFAVNSKKVTLNDLDINTIVTADNLPNKKINTQVNAAITYQIEDQLATIKMLKVKVDQIELAGEVSLQTADITKVRYNLATNNLDLNNYITKTADTKQSSPDGTNQTASSSSNTAQKEPEVEPDLGFLHDLDVDGYLKIAGIKVDKINIGEIKNHLIINKGKAQIKSLSAELYEGLLTLNGHVSDSKGQNEYQVFSTLKDVQIHPLLIDVADIDLISGNTGFNFKGKGKGLTATKIKQGLIGKGSFSLLNGEIYGVNIPQEIRGLKAKLTGKKAPTTENIKKTDFASLTGNFNINKGLVNNQKFLMLSPIMRLDGSGLVHIVKETLDYKLSISPLSSGKADTDFIDLNGLTIPMLIKGSFTDPKISLDTEGALKEQLKAKLNVEKKRLKEKANKELKKYQDKIGKEAQEKIKQQGKSLEDKFKKFF
jgi:AsmA protein